jgi:hypothetical protein
MVMLANRKEAAQIEHDLEAFLLDRAAPFVSWLWTTIAQLASASDLIIEGAFYMTSYWPESVIFTIITCEFDYNIFETNDAPHSLSLKISVLGFF